LQDYGQAIADFGRAIELNPEDATAYYNIASVYALMEQAEEACGWLEKAIGLDEEYQEMARDDQDFDPVREDARFKALIGEDE
jgi:tetratricopeptide (TPR) repeat protein